MQQYLLHHTLKKFPCERIIQPIRDLNVIFP